MKIALCLHGLASGQNDSGVPVSFESGMESMKENVMKDHDVDVFFHTWSKDSEKELIEGYKPCDYQVEDQITFDHPFSTGSTQYSFTPDIQVKLQSMYSRWYSFQKSVELKKKQEEKTGKTYDFVLNSRFDIVYYEPFIEFDKLDSTKMYVSNWWHNKFNFGYNDPWIISGSEGMDSIGGLYDNIGDYLAEGSDYEKNMMSIPEISPRERPEIDHKISNHGLLRWHSKNVGLETNFIGLEYTTWSLIRKINHGRNNPYYPSGFPFSLIEPLQEERLVALDGPRGSGW